jgi:DnaK suppressor protein
MDGGLDIFRQLLLDNLYSLNKEEQEDNLKEKGDEVDLTTMERENILSFKLRGRDNFLAKKIFAALQRLKEGNFGICQECGERIEEGRLLARPTATVCLSCKEEEEREECHILYERKSHTLGQGLGLSKEVGNCFN